MLAWLRSLPTRPLGLGALGVSLVLDQLVKAYFLFGGPQFATCQPCQIASAGCRACDPIVVLPFFNITMVWNRGVSFGLFPASGAAGLAFLIVFATVVVTFLLIWLWKSKGLIVPLGIGLVAGGAIGNVIDRIRFGAVADFFHLHAFGYDWYVFNVADAAIVVGVAFLIYDSIFGERPGEETQARG